VQNKGIFITFEGPDGSGKSTIISKLYETLKLMNLPFNIVITREPGGKDNIVAEDIRNIILNKRDYKISSHSEALLFAASRAQHVYDFIKPHLDKGDLVICDRYVHSSLVYQGYARGIGIDNILKINEFAMDGALPNLVIILMVDPHKGMERIKINVDREFNRLDQEMMIFHEKVYAGYKEIINNDKTNTIMAINADRSIETILEDVKGIVMKKINEYVNRDNY
jgi:dTMP kinase